MVNYVIYSKKDCSRCEKVKTIIECSGNEYDEMVLGDDFDRDWLENVLYNHYGVKHKMFPYVFLNGEYIGSVDEIVDLLL